MWRRLVILLTALVALTVIAAVTIYWCSGWSEINCWTREINIRTGHQRYTRYWFWRITEQRIEPTWISETLSTSVPSSANDAAWQLVVTLSPGTGHSPHYVFHGALYDLQNMQHLLLLVPADPAVRRTLASSILWLWQAFNNDSEAEAYISDVSNAAIKADRLSASDVPPLKDWLLARRKKITAADLGSPYAQILDEVIASAPSPTSP
ncbi:MAG: hypothetical protein RIQ79_1267 [Verrucomicrobiota bacterium]|jgi:hypothetical protein